MVSEFGTLVIGGVRFEISQMCVLKGKLHIRATADGPIPAMIEQPITIFGIDGQGFVQGGKVSVSGAPAGWQAGITVDIEMLQCQ